MVIAQSAQEYQRRIENKLRNDIGYLNLYYYNFTPEEFQNPLFMSVPKADGETVDLSKNLNGQTTFIVYYLPAGRDLSERTIVFIESNTLDTAAVSGGLGEGSNTEAATESAVLLNFRDLFAIRNTEVYALLLNMIEKLEEEVEPSKTLTIPIDEELKTSRGVTSTDNSDYLNYAKVNYHHKIPTPKEPVKKQRTRRGTQPTEESKETEYTIDANFYRIGFSHKSMQFGIGGTSVEINAQDRVLNILPFQSTNLAFGLRFLFSFTGTLNDIKDALAIDTRLFMRAKVNLAKSAESLPFMFAGKPKLNLNSGAGFEMSMTRLSGLPFLNFYAAFNGNTYSEPSISFGRTDSSWSYFSTFQWEGTMSFYWNTSIQKTGRFRMDIGAAGFDIVKNVVNGNTIRTNGATYLQPVISFKFDFVPNDDPLFGVGLRIMDSRATITNWFKLLQIEGHVARFEMLYLADPVLRNMHEWEADGGALFTVRYRYGF